MPVPHLCNEAGGMSAVTEEDQGTTLQHGKCCLGSIHEAARDVARDITKTTAYKQSRSDRKKVDRLFAYLKHILQLDRLRLRGMSGARDEFLSAATVQSLRRMADLLSQSPPLRRSTTPA